MRIIPVLDVMNGHVVRAIGGRRTEYQPLNAQRSLAEFAEFMLQAVDATELYLADLDAIQHGSISPAVQAFLNDAPSPILLDAGLRTSAELQRLGHSSQFRRVIASETWQEALPLFPASAIFSLDLFHNELRLANTALSHDIFTLVEQAVTLGCRSFIALDVAAVGEAYGPTILDLCTNLKKRHPKIELISGGGIRDRADVQHFADAGCDAVLVSTAIHRGTLR